MNLTTKYISKSLFSSAILVILILTSIIWLTQSLRLLEMMVNSSAPISLFLKMIMFSIPKFMEVIIPIAVTVSVIFVYSKMIADNEIVIMRSSGISPLMIAKPALIVAGAMTLFLFINMAFISPIALTKLQNLKQIVKAEYSVFLLREGVFNPISKDLTVYLRERGKKGELKGLLIHDTRPVNKTPVTIVAKRGVMVSAENEPKVLIYDGMRQQFNSKTQSLSKLEFEQYTLEISNFQAKIKKRWRYAKERTLFELLRPNLEDSRIEKYIKPFKAEAYRRIIIPFNNIGYTLIALSCLLLGSFNRRGQSKKIIIAVCLVLLMQSVYMGLTNIMRSDFWAIPVLYMAVIIPIIIGFFLMGDWGRFALQSLENKITSAQDNLRKKAT